MAQTLTRSRTADSWRGTGDEEARARAFVDGVIRAVQEHVRRRDLETAGRN